MRSVSHNARNLRSLSHRELEALCDRYDVYLPRRRLGYSRDDLASLLEEEVYYDGGLVYGQATVYVEKDQAAVRWLVYSTANRLIVAIPWCYAFDWARLLRSAPKETPAALRACMSAEPLDDADLRCLEERFPGITRNAPVFVDEDLEEWEVEGQRSQQASTLAGAAELRARVMELERELERAVERAGQRFERMLGGGAGPREGEPEQDQEQLSLNRKIQL